MAWKVDAAFEDGVFVPDRRLDLAERQRVRLIIEPAAHPAGGSEQNVPREGHDSLASHTSPGLAIALDFHPDGC